MRLALVTLLLIAGWHAPLPAKTLPRGRPLSFEATAYALKNPTATGNAPKAGTVAADTDLLPLGTKIRVANAGAYSGIYTVADTGRKMQGRKIDIFLPSAAHAKRFGRKAVRVTVLKWGEAE
jgi:3D (Asp-Asp-Asp) domain-containing protein